MAAELTLSAGDEDEDGIAVYKAVKEKTLSLLPSLAPTILDRYQRIKMPGSRGDLTVFTSALMTLSDSIYQALAKKGVKMITDQSDNHNTIKTLNLEKQPGGNSIHPQIQLVSSSSDRKDQHNIAPPRKKREEISGLCNSKKESLKS